MFYKVAIHGSCHKISFTIKSRVPLIKPLQVYIVDILVHSTLHILCDKNLYNYIFMLITMI